MLTREATLKEAIDFLELNAYEGSDAITTLRMGDIEEILKPIRKLVNEHFNPQPYKFEDLRTGMFVFDCIKNRVNKIIEIFEADVGIPYIKFDDGFGEWFIIEFEENRFFSLTKALEYQE